MRAVGPTDRLFERQLAADTARVVALKRAYEEKLFHMGIFVERLAPWKVFGTFTFRFPASVESAKRCFENFLRRTLPFKVSVFWVVELHPGGHGAHVHALFDRLDWPRREMWQAWFKRYGRARIDRLRSFRGRDYCASKYVCKDTSWWSYRLSKQNFSNVKSAHPETTERGGSSLTPHVGAVPLEPVGDSLESGSFFGESTSIAQTPRSAIVESNTTFAPLGR